MNIRKMQKLEKLGFPQNWLDDVKKNFHPKKKGKYEIKIYDLQDIGDDPEEGIWIDTTCFDDDLGLSIVLHFFEGCGYVMRLTSTGKEIGRGILDHLSFDEAQKYDDKEWEWRFDEVKELIAKQVAEENAKPREYIRKRNKTKEVMTKMKNYKIVYKETLIHTFDVEASSEEEAKAVFEKKIAYGEFDFSDGEIDTTEFIIKEV